MFFRRDKMQVIFFSLNIDTADEFLKRQNIKNSTLCYDLESLQEKLQEIEEYILVVDYDSVAKEFNSLISSNRVPPFTVVLERVPEIATGKMLISHSIGAYGNIRMQKIHFAQVKKTLKEKKVWTYPELNAALIKETKKPTMSSDSKELIERRLTEKEKEVLYLILDGLTNDAIATTLDITTRTIKAHVGSIFKKLHVNDRISLVLLLR